MKRLLLLLLLTPAAQAFETLNYDAGYEVCFRSHLSSYMTREQWNQLDSSEKDTWRAEAHRACVGGR